MSQQNTAYIAVGSNIAPRDNIAHCLQLLGELPDSRLVAESHWYATKPWGVEAQPNFINLVVGLDTRLSARDLLLNTQSIEKRLQRTRSLKNGPRTIDLDILLFADAVIAEPDFSIPHPGLLERDFVLLPLLDIAPEYRHPLTGQRLGELAIDIRYRQIIGRIAAP